MSKQSIKKTLKVVFNVLLAIAPILVVSTSSLMFWGEPEAPEVFEK